MLNGYGKRDHNWDFSTEIQHELVSGFAVTGGYYHNTGGYFRYAFGSPFSSKKRVTDNLAVTPADYDPFCITAPSNPDLPGGGGYQVCGLANVKQDKFGSVQNLVTPAENFGEFVSTNDFFNVAHRRAAAAQHPARRRLRYRPLGARTAASSSTRRRICHDCRVVTPFKAQTQVKLNGVFPLPAAFVASFAFVRTSPGRPTTPTTRRTTTTCVQRSAATSVRRRHVRHHTARRAADVVRGSHRPASTFG